MPRRKFNQELEKLRRDLEAMSELVQKALKDAMLALKNRDMELSSKVIKLDNEETNLIYREIEERCIYTIALHQPVAGDLRFISTTMNVASNLERIGDYSKDIAMIVPFIVNEGYSENEEKLLKEMSEIAKKMIRDAMDAFIDKDKDKVNEVNISEEKVDSLYENIFPKLKEMVKKNPEKISLSLNLLLVARYLERIADHAVNIADRTMYAIKGNGEYL